MKKFYPGFFTLFFSFLFYAASAQVVTFSFSGSVGNETSWPSSTTDIGVEPTTITRGTGISAIANGDRFNANNWTTASSPDITDYLEFTITPSSGYSIDIGNIQLQHQRSSTGPRKFVIRTSLNGFSADASNVVSIADVNTLQNNTFTLASFINTTVPVTFRLYAYAAETGSGTWGPGEGTGDDIAVFGAFMILPIKFENVKAIKEDESIKIVWTNAGEENVLQYVVEHGTNGTQFNQLYKIDPLKNNGSKITYSFYHERPFNEVNFYRIKASEINGSVVFSPTVTVKKEISLSLVTIYANPLDKNEFKLDIKNLEAGPYQLNIRNAAGQLIKTMRVEHSGGVYTQSVFLNNARSGIHYLDFFGNTRFQKHFLIK
jgi:hypothetical protein